MHNLSVCLVFTWCAQNNGCICCTVRGDLIRIMTKLLARPEKLDMIIIETTGEHGKQRCCCMNISGMLTRKAGTRMCI